MELGGHDRTDAAADPWPTLQEIRARAPLVHNMINLVAMDLAANLLLATGAAPAMVHAAEEVEDFLDRADALTINIGTLSSAADEPMARAARKAVELGRPWILDPVGVGATPFRSEAAVRLSRLQPTIIRGNGSEILALGGERSTGRGVESGVDSAEALDAARDLARATGAIVATTGAVDYVTDGERIVAVANGHPMMTRVTAMGCALTCLIGACCAVNPDHMAASAHGLAIFGLAGELAAAETTGPGSFRARFIDEIYTMDQAKLGEGARIQ